MKGWLSQIMIGIIVTVIGTVLANAIVGKGRGKQWKNPRYHFSRPAHPGR